MTSSHDGDLHAVDWRQRVEEALPALAAVTTDPKLAGGCPEVERGRRQLVDVHRVAQHREITLLFRQPLRELLPRAAAVFAAPDARRAVGTGACLRGERHNVNRISIVRMHHDREAEVGWQSFAD